MISATTKIIDNGFIAAGGKIPTIFLQVWYTIYCTISGLPCSPDLLVVVGAALGGLGTPSYID